MKNRTLALSVLLNLALGAAFLWIFIIARPAPNLVPPPPPANADTRTVLSGAPVPVTPVVANPATTNFHWKMRSIQHF